MRTPRTNKRSVLSILFVLPFISYCDGMMMGEDWHTVTYNYYIEKIGINGKDRVKIADQSAYGAKYFVNNDENILLIQSESLVIVDTTGVILKTIVVDKQINQSAISHDHSTIAIVCRGTSGDDILTIKPDGTDIQLIVNDQPYVYDLSFSHDGRKISFVTPATVGTLRVVDLTTGEARTILADSLPAWSNIILPYKNPVFSANDDHLVYFHEFWNDRLGRCGSTMCSVDLNNGKISVIDSSASFLANIAISPINDRIYYFRSGYVDTLCVSDSIGKFMAWKVMGSSWIEPRIVISNDGSKMLISEFRYGDRLIEIFNMEDLSVRPLVKGSNTVLSDDGSMVLFNSQVQVNN